MASSAQLRSSIRTQHGTDRLRSSAVSPRSARQGLLLGTTQSSFLPSVSGCALGSTAQTADCNAGTPETQRKKHALQTENLKTRVVITGICSSVAVYYSVLWHDVVVHSACVISFHLLIYSLGCGASCDSSDILACKHGCMW